MTPEGWRRARLEETVTPWLSLCQPSADDCRRYVALEHLAQGEPRLLGWAKASEATSTKAEFGAGDVLYGKLRPNLRKAVLASFDGICSTDILVLRPKECLDARFLLNLVHHPSFQTHAVGTASGTKMPRTSWSLLAPFAFALPPLAEQWKIAAILSSVDDAIEASQAVIDQLQVVKKAMMAELLTRGLPGHHKKFKKTEIGEIPEAWCTRTYGELASSLPRSIQSGPFGSALRHEEFRDDGVFVVGIDNVQDGYFSRGAEHRITPAKFEELRKFALRAHDLLIVVTGASTGRACVFPSGWETAILTKHVYRITINLELADAYFLLACLQHLPSVVNRVRGVAQGLSRPGLNKDLLLPTIFPLPTLEEQRAIARATAVLDERIVDEQATLLAHRFLKSALMSVLLTGEVRVRVDEDAAA